MNILYQAVANDVTQLMSSIYDSKFADLFSPVSALYDRFQSSSHPVTDAELEEILTTVPLNLFTVSERVAELKTMLSVTKLENRRRRIELADEYRNQPGMSALSDTVRRERTTEYVDMQMEDGELLIIAYTSIIERVENEISFSRELIMGAKKLWDARRATLESNPVSPIRPSDASRDPLPDYPWTVYPSDSDWTQYSSNARDAKKYIKGAE